MKRPHRRLHLFLWVIVAGVAITGVVMGPRLAPTPYSDVEFMTQTDGAAPTDREDIFSETP